ncbi:hypothetical protein M9H77_13555 [Catharanthus roseus]|uniref:Uncharacterized protein n=1 Tax=Catharanthus roseus TaxID=4058 RepID=A0ACC0BKQ8_CATRO|nr:hypothetical protein M9H77_13555 [Catharanthus roseus]
MVRPSDCRGDDDLGPVTDRTGASGSSTQPLPVPFRSRPPHSSPLSHTPVPYEAYRFEYPHSHPSPIVYDPYLAAPTVRPHISYRSSAQEPLTEFSGHRGIDDEDDDDGDDDDNDEGAGAEEQPIPVAPVAYASGSDGRPRHGKGKGLTGSFMSVMSKITGCTDSYTEEESEGFRLGADRASRGRSC